MKFSLTPNHGMWYAVPAGTVDSDISSLIYEHMQILPQNINHVFSLSRRSCGAEQTFLTYFYVHCNLLSI
jgi:hypothetical protein